MSDMKEKMTFLQWIDNFWYHNKAATIIGAFAILLVSVASCQFFTKKPPDVFVYSVGESGIAPKAADEFRSDMQDRFASDVNNDGKVVVDLKSDTFVMVDDGTGKKYVYDPSQQMTETQRFTMELGMFGECVVYIMDPSFFIPNVAYFASLEDVLGYTPENALEGKGIVLSDLIAYKTTSLIHFPEEYVICVVEKKDRFDDKYYEGNVEFFKKLVEYK